MEVKNNSAMDQLLVNTAAQAPANQKASKDTDRPDFDSMVNQKRSEKSEPKAEKAAAKPSGKPEDAKTVKAPANGEQYALAAAMMLQPQPELRIEPMPEEPVMAAPELVVEAAQADGVELTVEMPAQDATPEIPVEGNAEAKPETAELPQEAAAPTQQQTEAAPEIRTGRPVEAGAEAPEQKPDEPQQTVREEAPHAQDAPEQPRFVRNETRPQEENDSRDDGSESNAQAVQAAPLFERVDAAPVKVAEAPRPIPLEAQNGTEQLGKEIDGILVNDVDANRIEVTLTPDNLGKLTVEISRNENGMLSIVLHPTTERAANLLERNTGNLQNALMSGARNDVQVQVRPAEESQQQFLDPDGQNEQQRQQQQQQQGRRHEQRSAQDFLQQLRLGLVDVDDEP